VDQWYTWKWFKSTFDYSENKLICCNVCHNSTIKNFNVVNQSHDSVDVKTASFERKIRCRETGLTPTLHASIHAKNQYATLRGLAYNTRAEVYLRIDDHRMITRYAYIFCSEKFWPDRFPVCQCKALRRKQVKPVADPVA